MPSIAGDESRHEAVEYFVAVEPVTCHHVVIVYRRRNCAQLAGHRGIHRYSRPVPNLRKSLPVLLYAAVIFVTHCGAEVVDPLQADGVISRGRRKHPLKGSAWVADEASSRTIEGAVEDDTPLDIEPSQLHIPRSLWRGPDHTRAVRVEQQGAPGARPPQGHALTVDEVQLPASGDVGD